MSTPVVRRQPPVALGARSGRTAAFPRLLSALSLLLLLPPRAASATAIALSPPCTVLVSSLTDLTAAYAPGAVVCLAAGTYSASDSLYLTHSGAASAPITYQPAPGATVTIRYTGAVQQTLLGVPAGVSYVTVTGFTLDGNNTATNGLNCNGGMHVSFIGNYVTNAGGGGITTYRCDYLTISGNNIYHTGYGSGWSSGISLNSDVWSDQATGYHDSVTGNVVAGSVDNSSYHTDGNGIILDSGGNTPPVLISGNIVYMNGGRCIHLLEVANGSVVGNVCYKNGLDLRVTGVGEISLASAGGATVSGNLIEAWGSRAPIYYDQSQATFSGNTYSGGGAIDGPIPPGGATQADPGFAAPPAVDPSADGQYALAPTPGAWVAAAFATRPPVPAAGGIAAAAATVPATAAPPATSTATASATAPPPPTATSTATATRTPVPPTATGTPTPALAVLKVASAGLKPKPLHGGRNVCTVYRNNKMTRLAVSGGWTKARALTGPCAGAAGWLPSAYLSAAPQRPPAIGRS